MPTDTDQQPVVPASVILPELTGKAVLLSVLLAAVLTAANAYLGLFAGMTVSASIPAAVVSMAVLRWWRNANILENNLVQTAASSGEALAAGIIFTIPALLLIGYWPTVPYWPTTLIAVVGGTLGVLCTIPLRRALIVEARLRFPEGVATAEVLKVGSGRGGETGTEARGHPGAQVGLRTLLIGAVAGAGMKFGESGLRLWHEAWEGAASVGGTVVYAGINLSPALLAVGYILGLNTAAVVCMGGLLGWGILLPLLGAIVGTPAGADSITAAKTIWSGSVRYVGIGAMLVGGLWTLSRLREPVWRSVQSLLRASKADFGHAHGRADRLPRTERDASLPWIVAPFALAMGLMAWLYHGVVGTVSVALLMTIVMGAAAFLFSSVAAYMAGVVGSSGNPVSGVTIATIMLAALLLVALLGAAHPAGPAATLLIGAVVCCAAAMGGDNLQDLKTGHIVGATPWKQQIMQVVGVVTGAVVIVPVLLLLKAKYGIGDATPDHPHPLSAPQATLMAGLALGVFGGQLPWSLVGLGAAIGVAVIVLDERLRARGSAWRAPVLAVALGIYLPLKLSAAILLGGVVAEAATRRTGRISRTGRSEGNHQGLLCAAGLVTGEALMGILLALPIVVSSVWPSVSADPFRLFAEPPFGAWPGVVALGAVVVWLYRAATRTG